VAELPVYRAMPQELVLEKSDCHAPRTFEISKPLPKQACFNGNG
jgi:hypothetical protein